MTTVDNIEEVVALEPDFMGFIFYPLSKRYAGGRLSFNSLQNIPSTIIKVGVFVNSDFETVKTTVDNYGLDMVQLHGKETPEFCKKLDKIGISVVKAFSIDQFTDFTLTKEYEPHCRYFLFDTATPDYGGAGRKFDWTLLNKYTGKVPFLLAGGISPSDAEEVHKIDHPKMFAIDINSKFESKPGIKDLCLLKPFIQELRSLERY